MFNIPEVEFELALPDESVAAIDLCPTGNAGAHLMAARLLRRIARQVGGRQGAGADQTHLAPQHIPEFRQLVQTGGSEQVPPAGQPFGIAAGAAAHAAEFYDVEGRTAPSGPLLLKEDRPAEMDEL